MLIRLDDPSFVDDFCAHFRRAGFAADPAGGSMVEVDRLDAPSRVQADNEVRVHLQLWRIMNPGQEVEVVPQ